MRRFLERGALVVAGPISEIADRLEQRRYAMAYGHAAPAMPGMQPGQAPQGVPQQPARDAQLPPTPQAAPGAEPAPQTLRIGSAEPGQAPQEGAQPHPNVQTPQQAAGTTPGGVPVPGSARKRLKLRVLTNPNQAAQLLWGGPGILEIEVNAGGTLLIGYQGNEPLVAEMVRHLVSNGVAVVGVEPERNELERIFLGVTKGEMQ